MKDQDSKPGGASEARQTRRRDVLKTGAAAMAATILTNQPASGDFTPVRSLPTIAKRAISKSSDYKKQALADYAANMRPFGGALSRHGRRLLQAAPPRNVPWDFDAVVVGSGYGASICAARLAMARRPGVRLAVIERGKEWVPGTFGDTLNKKLGESRFRLLGPRRNTVSNPVGLVNVVQNDEVNVLSGNGLGGSSLINANVAIRPDRECFERMRWPAALRDRAVLDPYYDRAAWELGVQTECVDHTLKAKAQRLAAQRLAGCGANFEMASLTITRATGCGVVFNRQGIRQRGCIDCGDCASGCNVGAKNTLAMNYLPLARRYGAEIYTHTEVCRVQKLDGYYRVYFKTYTPGRRGRYEEHTGSVTSRLVILGAGSLGTCEILLRSRGCGMELSNRVGQQWTMNGDAIGFVRKSQNETRSAGVSAYPNRGQLVGPTIQTNLTYPARAEVARRVLIQESSAPRAYANALGALMLDMDMDQTLILLGMGHDGASGRVTLRDDGLAQVKWPGIKESAYRRLIRSEFARVAEAHGGKYKYLRVFGDNYITVHPLGGCAMADDPRCGVTDDFGRVFDPRDQGMIETLPGFRAPGRPGAPVHQGLYVADGSLIPDSIGCNPLLTISALAERIAENIVIDPGNADLFAPNMG